MANVSLEIERSQLDASQENEANAIIFILKWAIPDLFFVYFRSFSNKHQYNFYNKSMWINVHPLYSAGIWTHSLHNASLIP